MGYRAGHIPHIASMRGATPRSIFPASCQKCVARATYRETYAPSDEEEDSDAAYTANKDMPREEADEVAEFEDAQE